MASPRQFVRRVNQRADDVPENAAIEVRKAIIRALQVLMTETPRDTGLARSNYFVSIGKPNTGRRKSPNEGLALSKGMQSAQSFESGQTAFITNNLPYIIPLNNGHSKQSQNFVQKAQRAVLDQFKKVKVLSKTGSRRR